MLKLHCKRCNSLIREISIDEAKKLKGEEICRDCQQFAKETLEKINEAQKRALQEIGSTHNKAVLKLEELMRQVFND